jgi:hypothetical protein
MTSQHTQTLTRSMAQPVRRASSLRIALLDAASRAGRSIWLALEAHGRERSRHELLAIAERWQHDQPKLARELRSYLRGGSSY